jgi:hypothetical protein
MHWWLNTGNISTPLSFLKKTNKFSFMKKYIITKLVLLTFFQLFSAGCYFDNLYSYSDIFGPYMKIIQLALLNGEQGVAQWAKSTNTSLEDVQYNSIAAGSDGIYVAGYMCQCTCDFGNSIIIHGLNVNTEINAVLVKYDIDGNAQWARTIKTGPAESIFNSITVGSDGIYAAGVITGTETYYFSDTVSIAGTYADGYNVVLVKYDVNGNALWAKSVTEGTNSSSFNSVAVGSDGMYAAGAIAGNGTYKFSDIAITAGTYHGESNLVLVKYDLNGNAQWARSVSVVDTPGLSFSLFNSVAVGSDGVYAAGLISNYGTYNFGNSTTVRGVGNTDSSNVLLVQYDTDGNAHWAKSERWVTASNIMGASYTTVKVGSDGIYAAGYIMGDALYDFGNSATVSGTSDKNTVLVKYDAGGNAQWARSVIVGPNNSSFSSIAIGNDDIYAAGYITGNGMFDFGSSVKVSGADGESNVVLVKYDLSGNALLAKSVLSGSDFSQFNSVTVWDDGIYAAGYIFGSSTFDFGNTVILSSDEVFHNHTHGVLVKYR